MQIAPPGCISILQTARKKSNHGINCCKGNGMETHFTYSASESVIKNGNDESGAHDPLLQL